MKEFDEERTLTKGNPLQSDLKGTQGHKQETFGLQRVREAAKADKDLRLNNLLSHITESELWPMRTLKRRPLRALMA